MRPARLSIDSTIVKAHKDAGSKKRGNNSRGGNTTKIHTTVDMRGKPLRVKLTGGQVHDVTVAPELIADLKSETVMGDAVYDSNKFREQIIQQGASACIKPWRNRKVAIPFDKEQYKERYKVKCFFQKNQTLSQNCHSLRRACQTVFGIHTYCLYSYLVILNLFNTP